MLKRLKITTSSAVVATNVSWLGSLRRPLVLCILLLLSSIDLVVAAPPLSDCKLRLGDKRYDWSDLDKMLKSIDWGHRIEICGKIIAATDSADPDHLLALWGRSVAYRHKKQIELSKRDLDRLIELSSDTEYLLAYHERGMIHFNRNNFEAAAADFAKIIAGGAEILEPYFYIVKSFEKIGDRKNELLYAKKFARVYSITLCRSSNRSRVITLQKELSSMGYYRDRVDGICGANTKRAVRECAMRGECALRTPAGVIHLSSDSGQ